MTEFKSATTEHTNAAAIYIRMSTDHQKYSIENQTEALKHYANQRQLDITATYIDKARSGLTLSKRPALKKLLEDVKSQTATFRNILVLESVRDHSFF